MRTAALALVLCAAACTTTVSGDGRLAADVYVPPPPTAAPTTPAPTGTPPATTTAPRTPAPSTPSGTPTVTPPTIPPGYAGTWQGTMTQPRSVVPRWTAVLRLTAGRTTGTFAVRGYCTGSALAVVASPARVVLFTVILSDPSGQCAGGGTVALVPVGDGRLRIRWVDSAVRTNVATGTLTRG